jgi:hypothetical protein
MGLLPCIKLHPNSLDARSYAYAILPISIHNKIVYTACMLICILQSTNIMFFQ